MNRSLPVRIAVMETRIPADGDEPNPVWLVTASGDDGVLVGSLTMEINPDPADRSRAFAGWVSNVYVDPPARGQGVAVHLLAAARALAAQKGCLTMGLVVTHDNPARRLYERFGFRPCWPVDKTLIAYVLAL